MRILVADDSRAIRRKVESVFSEQGFEVVQAQDGAQALAILEADNPPPLAIVDWMMPGLDGLELCRTVRSWPEERYIYLLLLTANDRKEDILAGLKAGADDYLTKPFEDLELLARLMSGQRVIELHRKFLKAARTDTLSGLWNQGAICECLAKELARSLRTAMPIGVILGDLDHFKRVNDTLGHLAGDEVLRETSRRIRGTLRHYDEAGRYGGEEFLVVAPGCTTTGLTCLAERLRNVIGGTPMKVGDGEITVTISLGAAISAGQSEADVKALLQTADSALYRAKEGGRNRVCLAPT